MYKYERIGNSELVEVPDTIVNIFDEIIKQNNVVLEINSAIVKSLMKPAMFVKNNSDQEK